MRITFTLFILHSYKTMKVNEPKEVVRVFFYEHVGLLCKKFVKVSPAADAARKSLVLISHYSVYPNINVLK